jgi:hypothetical protein
MERHTTEPDNPNPLTVGQWLSHLPQLLPVPHSTATGQGLALYSNHQSTKTTAAFSISSTDEMPFFSMVMWSQARKTVEE